MRDKSIVSGRRAANGNTSAAANGPANAKGNAAANASANTNANADVAGLVAARIAASDGDGSVILEVGSTRIRATVDPSVHAAVIAAALARKERVVAQREDAGWVVIGALRTSPTPGIETADEYVIRAGRVHVDASHEFRVTSGLSSIAVRAYGHVETLADQITSRASSIHKVVGRMLHLN